MTTALGRRYRNERYNEIDARAEARGEDRGHSRAERWIIEATEVRVGIGFPTPSRPPATAGLWPMVTQTDTIHAVTRLPTHRASPTLLAELARGHWTVENHPAAPLAQWP